MMPGSERTSAIRIAILAMGGEGGGVLAAWIVAVAEANGHIAQLTSVPGVAQRTGATNYYVELFPEDARPAGREPVMALTPSPGDIDVVIASELMEAGRAIQRGLVTPDRTTLITSTARVYAMSERLALGDGRVESDKIVEACRIAAHRLVALDLAAIAETSGSVISAAMLGALAGARVLPFERAQFEAAIERGGVGVAASKRAFAAAFDAAESGDISKVVPVTMVRDDPDSVPTTLTGAALLQDALKWLQPGAVDVVDRGVERLVDYQDEAYARAYLDRLKPIAALDAGYGDGTGCLTAETARGLALGMAYEDTIRVAELKIRAARFDRVREEVHARDGQIVEIAEFLHPRPKEIVESVPAPLGRFLQRNAMARAILRRATRSGKIVNTTSIRGFVLLSAVASLKPRRRSSMRYHDEQRHLESWLAEIARVAPLDYQMAMEIAECQRLVKGYGDTHARGRASYKAILEASRHMPAGSDSAAHIAMLRAAALADETGDKLQALLRHMQMLGSIGLPTP